MSEQTWLDYAIRGTTPPVWVADRSNHYELLGVTDDGAVYPVWRNSTVYFVPLPTAPVWSGDATAFSHPEQRLRVTFHRAEAVAELTVNDAAMRDVKQGDPRQFIADQLFGRLVVPVSKAFHAAVDEAYGQASGDPWDKWQAQEKRRKELLASDHWFTMFAARHARAVLRMRPDGRFTAWTMQLEWATLEPLTD